MAIIKGTTEELLGQMAHYHTDKIRQAIRTYVRVICHKRFILKADKYRDRVLTAMVEAREDFVLYGSDTWN